jgi:sugar diacid utilization regulator
MTEVQGRQRALLLVEILDNAASPARQTVEHATLLGWRLSGWHTVVHLAIAGDTVPAGLATDLEVALATAGITAPVVQRPDGWMFWVTDEVARDSSGQDKLARKVRKALLGVESKHDGLRMCAGVGLPAEGSIGLGNSLREARKASLLARASQTMAAVERTDPIGLKRMLLAWYSYGPARDIAAEVLQPLRVADPTGELTRTLGCFLDHESSITATAAVLGVHRNTVLSRLTRIRSVLGVDLSDPNDRLAAHLATRAEQLPPDRPDS